MTSKAHVAEARDIYRAEPKAATKGRNWGIAIPIGLLIAAAVAAGILGIMGAGTAGEQAVQGAQLGIPFYGF